MAAAAAAAERRGLSGEGGREGGLRCPPCRVESALAAAVVTEAAAATTGETAAQVGEAAAADEEEGEAAAAAKGKRTALRGLGGIPSPAPRARTASGTGSARPGREALVGRPRLPRLGPRFARVLPAVARRGEAPRVLQGGWGRGAWGLARAPGRRGRGDRACPGAQRRREPGVGVPCPRPAPGPVIWKWEGGKQTPFGGTRVWITMTSGPAS